MRRIPVTSSNLRSVGYDADQRTLEVEFKSAVYLYTGVPQSEYEALMASNSKGQYFNAHIAHAYPYQKVA